MVTVPAVVPVMVAVPSLLSTTIAEPVPPVIVQACVIGKSILDGLPFKITELFKQTVEGPVMPTDGLGTKVTEIGYSVSQSPPERILKVPVYVPTNSPGGKVILIGLAGSAVNARSGIPLTKSIAYSSA